MNHAFQSAILLRNDAPFSLEGLQVNFLALLILAGIFLAIDHGNNWECVIAIDAYLHSL